jgi:glycosyltransferase involved in cell wall biosynthesis
MQSQAFFGADSTIHAQLMRHFDPSAVEVHVACNPTELADPHVTAIRRIRAIPSVRVRPTDFGPSLFGTSGTERLGRLRAGPAVLHTLVALAAYIRRHNIQIIHGTEKPRDALYGVLLGKLTGAKSVVHMHVSYGEWQSAAVKWALRHADAVVGVSHFTSQTIVDAGYPESSVHTVHNSLDLAGWDPTLDGAPIRQELGIAPDALVVGIVSRLFKWKGHGELLEAVALIKDEFPRLHFVIVGEDDPRADAREGSYRAVLEQRAAELHIKDRVTFTGFRTDIPQLMAAFDVFAHPSWEEPFGMVFLEAMAMGKPVVAWASGGAPEVIVDGVTGLLAERPSVPSLARSLSTVLRDPALRARLGEAGRLRAASVFTPQQMCRDTLAVYEAVLAHATPVQQRRPHSTAAG